ncbi:hypothetical protein [Desulfogranum mediterraneum]|uniref:hypothetical protein n=1 Tax=Desulfogranum mediterraneum TaxID=160661 RepID=UPI0012947DF5|nr:hypothetical protein [Desulfogranum mediterraneum]
MVNANQIQPPASSHCSHQRSIGMYSLLALFFALLLSCSTTPLSATVLVPKEIGGFRLGTSIDDYELTSYRNFLKQVVVEDIGGFRKGIIEYGVCERPGKIVRIKLKYADSSEGFYRELLKRYKKQLGEPSRYTGDAFGILKAWKWHFIDQNGERVSLTLQYNQKNLDESLGSVVKLAMPERIIAERKCFNRICATREPLPPTPKGQLWEEMIPR